jgi:hypothetical protein
MFVKLVHSTRDSFANAARDGRSESNDYTMIGNVRRVEFYRVEGKDIDVQDRARIWCFDDPVTGFVDYSLQGNPDEGHRKTYAVFVLNEEGKTIERYYPV